METEEAWRKDSFSSWSRSLQSRAETCSKKERALWRAVRLRQERARQKAHSREREFGFLEGQEWEADGE